MKKKLINNLYNNFGMKLLSVILAFIIWIVILNIDDPAITKTFTMPVDIINESAISTLDKVYKVTEGDVITFTVRGNRSRMNVLRATDFKATADLSKLSLTNAVPIEIEALKYANELVITKGKVNTMKLTLEDRVSAQFPIKVKTTGNVTEGYALGDISAKPNLITVSAGASVIDIISEVRVEVDIDNADQIININAEPKVYDKNGYVIEANNLIFSQSSIKVSVDLLKTKTVDLILTTTGEPADGYKMTGLLYEPKQITIAGIDGNLKDISSITIKNDISNASANIEEELNISEFLPENIKIADEDLHVTLKVLIEKLTTKELSFNIDEIAVKNIPTDMRVNFIESGIRAIKLIGLKSDLNSIEDKNLNPYVDLEGISEGKHYVDVFFDISENVKVVISPRVFIDLTSIYPNEEQTSETTLESTLEETTENTQEETTQQIEDTIDVEDTSEDIIE